MNTLSHLTNDEAINQLTLRDDLTDIEHDLLDRLIRTVDALKGLENSAQVLDTAGQYPELEMADGDT